VQAAHGPWEGAMSLLISRLVWMGVVVASVVFLRRLMPKEPVVLPDD